MSTQKKLSRREFLRASALTAAGLMAAQCVAPSQPQPAGTQPAAEKAVATSAPAPAAESVSLEFWECFAGIQGLIEAEKKVVEQFDEENTAIDVNYVEVPFEQSHEKLVTALATGAGPDAWNTTMVYNAEFGASGYLASLQPYIAAIEKDLVSASLEEAKYEGEVTVLPCNIDLYLQFYRSDILEEAGLKVPETMDQILESGLKLSDPQKPLYMFPVKGGRHTHFQVLSVSMAWNGPGVGNSIFDAEGNCLLNTDSSVEGYQWWGDLLMQHKISPPTSPTDQIPETRQQFFAGTLATTWDWLGAVSQFEQNVGRDKFGMVGLPVGPKGIFHPWGANGYMMSAASQNKDQTWKLLEYLLSPESNGDICQSMGILPANTKAFEQDWLKDPLFKPATDLLLSPEALQRVPTWLPIWTQYVTEVAIENNQKFLLGQQTAKESLDIQAAFLTEAQQSYLAGGA
jgi:multiple sugar transport system substrate-binding protein